MTDEMEIFFERGVTDGLPVVPPTRERVERMLAGTTRPREALVAEVPPSFGRATVEKLAINAVMAGCRPDYFPVVLAVVEAACDPAFNATIGRALRLVMINLDGTKAGEISMSTLGHPGRYTYCIGEHEEASPWEPLHVERGSRPEQSTVTLPPGEAPFIVNDHSSREASQLVASLGWSAAGVWNHKSFPLYGHTLSCPAPTAPRAGTSRTSPARIPTRSSRNSPPWRRSWSSWRAAQRGASRLWCRDGWAA